MSRKWNELKNDEIWAVWKEYLRTDGLACYDPLKIDSIRSKPVRLTPMEIIKLVEELMDRLEIKEVQDAKREMDSEDAHEERCSSRRNGCCKGKKEA